MEKKILSFILAVTLGLNLGCGNVMAAEGVATSVDFGSSALYNANQEGGVTSNVSLFGSALADRVAAVYNYKSGSVTHTVDANNTITIYSNGSALATYGFNKTPTGTTDTTTGATGTWSLISVNYSGANIAAMDTDGSGKVDETELKAFCEKLGASDSELSWLKGSETATVGDSITVDGIEYTFTAEEREAIAKATADKKLTKGELSISIDKGDGAVVMTYNELIADKELYNSFKTSDVDVDEMFEKAYADYETSYQENYNNHVASYQPTWSEVCEYKGISDQADLGWLGTAVSTLNSGINHSISIDFTSTKGASLTTVENGKAKEMYAYDGDKIGEYNYTDSGFLESNDQYVLVAITDKDEETESQSQSQSTNDTKEGTIVENNGVKYKWEKRTTVYNQYGQADYVKNFNGTTITKYNYSENGSIKNVKDLVNNTTTYYSAGKQSYTTNSNGYVTTTYDYNTNGTLAGITSWNNGVQTSITSYMFGNCMGSADLSKGVGVKTYQDLNAAIQTIKGDPDKYISYNSSEKKYQLSDAYSNITGIELYKADLTKTELVGLALGTDNTEQIEAAKNFMSKNTNGYSAVGSLSFTVDTDPLLQETADGTVTINNETYTYNFENDKIESTAVTVTKTDIVIGDTKSEKQIMFDKNNEELVENLKAACEDNIDNNSEDTEKAYTDALKAYVDAYNNYSPTWNDYLQYKGVNVEEAKAVTVALTMNDRGAATGALTGQSYSLSNISGSSTAAQPANTTSSQTNTDAGTTDTTQPNTAATTLSKVVDTVKNVTTKVKDAVSNIVDKVKGVVTKVKDTVKSIFNKSDDSDTTAKDIVSNVVDKVKSIVTKVKDAVKSIFNKSDGSGTTTSETTEKDSSTNAATIVSTVANNTTNVLDKVIGTANKVVSTVANSVKNVATTVVNNAKSVVEKVVSGVKSLVSKDTTKTEEPATETSDTTANGTTNAATIVSTVANDTTTVLDNVIGTANKVVSTVANSVKNVATTIVEDVSSGSSTVLSSISNWASGLKEAGKGVVQAVKEKEGVIPSVLNFFKAMF